MQDETRVKAADEFEWMNFETRVREFVHKLIGPIYELSKEDRESTIDMSL